MIVILLKTAGFFIVPALVLLFLFLISPGRSTKQQKKNFSCIAFCHRGLHSKVNQIPENSMAAFAAAVNAGYGIELDLQLSKDGQIVVFHDETLSRVCKQDGRVVDYRYEELRKFPLCGQETARIPLFTEVLSLVRGRVPLLIELKKGTRNQELCEKTAKLLKGYRGEFCIESFHPLIVRWFKKNTPTWFRGQLIASIREYGKEASSVGVFFLANLMTNWLSRPQFIACSMNSRSPVLKLCRKLGAVCFIWTIKDAEEGEQLRTSGISIIFEKEE